MSQIYVTDHNTVIGIDNGRITMKAGSKVIGSLPIESVDGITVIGNGQLTTACIGECIQRGIPIQYYSAKGHYFGKITSTLHINTFRQRQQIKLTENNEFVILLAKKILQAKINNQIVLLRRYQRTSENNIDDKIQQMKISIEKINQAEGLQEVIGFEGYAAKSYFSGLNLLLKNKDFTFNGRNRRPPKDPFNSMLSLGYTILMNDMYGAIEGRGLSPYFGFIHQDREKHPTLASDLMEEWRAIIVDSLVMSLVNGNEIDIDNFYRDSETAGIFFDKEGLKIFLTKIEKRFETSSRYLEYLDYPTTFRKAIDMQVLQLCKALEQENPDLYTPVKIR